MNGTHTKKEEKVESQRNIVKFASTFHSRKPSRQHCSPNETQLLTVSYNFALTAISLNGDCSEIA